MTPRQIQTLRRRLGLTRSELAVEVGVSASTVARWERGERAPGSRASRELERLGAAVDEPPGAPAPSGARPAPFTKEELIARLAAALERVPDVSYAIGGAEALAAHGYERFTNDVDVFVLESDLNRLMHALRAAGLETVTVFEPFHYAARLPDDPDWTRRVDVLAPGDDPELSAIFEAIPVERYGRRWRFFPAYLLAVAKFGALRESGDPRHAGDLFALYRRGIFEAGQARWAVARIWDTAPEELQAWDELIASFAAKVPRGRRTKKKRGRLPPLEEREDW